MSCRANEPRFVCGSALVLWSRVGWSQGVRDHPVIKRGVRGRRLRRGQDIRSFIADVDAPLYSLELLGKRRPYSQKQVAEAAKVSEFQASRWHDVPGYDDWHADQLHGAAIRLFNRGKVAVGCRILMTAIQRSSKPSAGFSVSCPRELRTPQRGRGRVRGRSTTSSSRVPRRR